MISTCVYLGIYPDNIEKASEVFETVCSQYGIDSDTVWECVREAFELQHGSNFGNHVAALMFDHLAAAVEREALIDGERIDYYCNGADVGFFIDGEEV